VLEPGKLLVESVGLEDPFEHQVCRADRPAEVPGTGGHDFKVLAGKRECSREDHLPDSRDQGLARYCQLAAEHDQTGIQDGDTGRKDFAQCESGKS